MEKGSQMKTTDIKGIVRNQTIIGTQDGQMEDLVNLRFKDGSWRTSGDGKLVFDASGLTTDGTASGTSVTYSQLYIHTNIYRHVLGVSSEDNKLYWFADIDADGETFHPLRSGETERPTAPVALCDTTGDITIVQTGHLLTIIDEDEKFLYYTYRPYNMEYKKNEVDKNGNEGGRSIYPFGSIHFNLYEPDFQDKYSVDNHLYYIQDNTFTIKDRDTIGNEIANVIVEMDKRNVFTRPFLICSAIKLYDGTYIYNSNVVLLYPRQAMNNRNGVYDIDNSTYVRWLNFSWDGSGTEIIGNMIAYNTSGLNHHQSGEEEITTNVMLYNATEQTTTLKPVGEYAPSFTADCLYGASSGEYKFTHYKGLGSDIIISLGDISAIKENADIFQSMCIFITPQVTDFLYSKPYFITTSYGESMPCNIGFAKIPESDIIKTLTSSNMYLLREYKCAELESNTSFIVDLTDTKYDNIVKDINNGTGKVLETDSFNRSSYCPRVVFSYNGRAHIANYKERQFYGYPIDQFILHNHSLQTALSGYYRNALNKLESYADNIHRAGLFYNYTDGSLIQYTYTYDSDAHQEGLPFACVMIKIDDKSGQYWIKRTIEMYDTTTVVNGRIDFAEKLNPFFSYPSYRVIEASVYVFSSNDGGGKYTYLNYDIPYVEKHKYYDMAFYMPFISPSMLGNGTSQLASYWKSKFSTSNTLEEYPNGLKVSKVDNPLVFPSENTYQVGSSDIVSIMSNAVAVGTGQTGSAPLYVFCKDGIYAMMVDSSGEMAYTNSRIIARDVCNKYNSAVPTDLGVVFTTDRGLMEIAGNEVAELSQSAEGDYLALSSSATDKTEKLLYNAYTMEQIASLPSDTLVQEDFLNYLRGGVLVNYNHNERELIVTNKLKTYSYVMDRNGQWSRRDYTADEYVNNYPTSYRVKTKDGLQKWYKVDAEENNDNSEADNTFYALSQVIKLDTLAYKQGYRFAARGQFETLPIRYEEIASCLNGFELISYQATKTIQTLYDSSATSNILELGKTYSLQAEVFMGSAIPTGNFVNVVLTKTDDTTETLANLLPSEQQAGTSKQFTMPSSQVKKVEIQIYRNEISSQSYVKYNWHLNVQKPATYLSAYVFGSYDGRKWAMLGGNEKKGNFANIGCKIEHTDVRYLRFCLAGGLTGQSRLDFIEWSADPSKHLASKLR